MKRYFFFTVVFILMIIITSCSCKPSASTIQTAIAQTQQNIGSLPPISTITTPETEKPILATTITSTATTPPEQFLGDAIVKDGYALTVISIQDPYVPKVYDPNADNTKRFVAISIILSNIDGDSLEINGGYGSDKVLDAEGYSYASTYDPSYEDQYIFYMTLEKGEKVNKVLFFEVPKTSTLSRITLEANHSGQIFTISASLQPAPEGHIPNPAPDSKPKTDSFASLGVPYCIDGYSLTVLRINETPKSLQYSQKEGYKFYAIQIEIENISGVEPLSVNALNIFLVDSQGYVYPASSGIEDELTSSDLLHGEKSKGWVIFRLPSNSTPFYVKYLQMMFSNEYLYSKLSS